MPIGIPIQAQWVAIPAKIRIPRQETACCCIVVSCPQVVVFRLKVPVLAGVDRLEQYSTPRHGALAIIYLANPAAVRLPIARPRR